MVLLSLRTLTTPQARFDRHFVRDLVWSRHQLEELAERRFRAAQQVEALAIRPAITCALCS